jgi:hypothetical protein
MIKTVLYEYLGTNGTILSPVHLEDIYYVRKLKLLADNGKRLTKDNKTFVKSIIIPEDELEEWKEV